MSGAVPERESGPGEHPLHALRIDLERYFPESRPWPWWRRWRRIATSQEIWILVSFRIGSWIRSLPAPWRWFLWLPWAANNRFLTTLLDTHLSIGAQIGPGLHLG
ncbi:MAG: hypothetical protein KC729_21190, partial [Candidatus Eisenbacteria bacterium]|nr:hypothetical protein [Candidatus Eisenbacteria bacterium]